MKRLNLTCIALLIILMSASNFCQNGSSLISRFQPESKLWLEGTSTLHDFTITANNIKSSISFESSMNENNSLEEFKITYLKLIVPIWRFDSGNESMDENTQEALSSDENPNIIFALTSPVDFSFDNINEVDSVQINSSGTLLVARIEKPIVLIITVIKQSESQFVIKGSKKLLMTDFNVEPPSMFFGTMNTGNEITVKFEMILNRK